MLRRAPAAIALAVVTAMAASCTSSPPATPDASATAGPSPSATPGPPPPPPLSPDPKAIQAAMTAAAAMSDEQAVGQLLMPVAYGADANLVTPDQAQSNQAYAAVDTPAQMVAAYHLGGLILMGQPGTETGIGSDNVGSPDQVRALTAGLQAAATADGAPQPLLIGTDQEEGVVTRITAPATLFPGNLALGAAGSADLAGAAATATGQELHAMGVNLDFAPVADVTAGPGNTVIGSRSFGADPAQVSSLTAAAVGGYQSEGVAASVKHFPGHGNTDVDSHVSTPVLEQSLQELTDRDLAPFRAGIAAGAAMVMIGHLDVTAVDPGTPATLSSKVMTGLLRDQLGFAGVVVTDALRMPPVTDRLESGPAAVHAVLAGADLLLLPANLQAAYDGLLGAVRDGSLPRERVNQSVARLLALRGQVAAVATPDPSVIGSAEHSQTALEVARAAVTLVEGPCSGPLVPVGPVRVVGADIATREGMDAALTAAGYTPDASAPTTIALSGFGGGAVTGDVAVALDTPYVLSGSSAPVKIAAYSDVPVSLQALAELLAGSIPATGRLPVTVDGLPATACG